MSKQRTITGVRVALTAEQLYALTLLPAIKQSGRHYVSTGGPVSGALHNRIYMHTKQYRRVGNAIRVVTDLNGNGAPSLVKRERWATLRETSQWHRSELALRLAARRQSIHQLAHRLAKAKKDAAKMQVALDAHNAEIARMEKQHGELERTI